MRARIITRDGRNRPATITVDELAGTLTLTPRGQPPISIPAADLTHLTATDPTHDPRLRWSLGVVGIVLTPFVGGVVLYLVEDIWSLPTVLVTAGVAYSLDQVAKSATKFPMLRLRWMDREQAQARRTLGSAAGDIGRMLRIEDERRRRAALEAHFRGSPEGLTEAEIDDLVEGLEANRDKLLGHPDPRQRAFSSKPALRGRREIDLRPPFIAGPMHLYRLGQAIDRMKALHSNPPLTLDESDWRAAHRRYRLLQLLLVLFLFVLGIGTVRLAEGLLALQ